MNYPKIVQSNNPSKPSVTNDFTNNVESNSTDKDNKMNVSYKADIEKMNSIKLEIMNSSEGYGTYYKKGDTYKEVFGNFGSDPNTTTPK